MGVRKVRDQVPINAFGSGIGTLGWWDLPLGIPTSYFQRLIQALPAAIIESFAD